jgi:hypothetical protein
MADVKQASALLGQFTALLKKEQFDDAKKTFNQIKVRWCDAAVCVREGGEGGGGERECE